MSKLINSIASIADLSNRIKHISAFHKSTQSNQIGKGLDFFCLFGIMIGVGALLYAHSIQGGHLSALINFPAFVIVVGGTVGAVLVQTPFYVFCYSLTLLSWIIFPPKFNVQLTISRIVELSKISRRKGLLALENALVDEDNQLLQKGSRLLVDGYKAGEIEKILRFDLELQENVDYKSAQVFSSLGGYAPTLGILGAVIGLIHVMENLAEPDKLGPGVAAAFVATVYGVGLANLIFLPISNRIRNIISQQGLYHDLIIGGIICIAQGQSPHEIDRRLQSYSWI